MACGVCRSFWSGQLPASRTLAGLALLISLGLGQCTGGHGTEPVVVARKDVRLRVDPNAVPPPVFSALPRLGPSMVSRIVEERERSPFSSLVDLSGRVRGMGPVTTEAVRPHLLFESRISQATPALASRDQAQAEPR